MLIRKNIYSVSSSSDLVPFMLENCLFFHNSSDVLNMCVQDQILVNDGVVKGNVQLNEGDVVTLLTPQSQEPKVNTDIDLLYEDEYFFAVSKPAQLPIHPTGKYYFNTLSSIIERTMNLCASHPYNRLDRETSGIVLFAKKPEFVVLLQETLIDKWYYALVFGQLKESGHVDEPLIKRSVGELRHHMMIDAAGKKSRTNFQIVDSNELYTLLSIELITGRKHQIRAHMAHLSHPVVGDKQYGNNSDFFVRFINNPSSFSTADIEKEVGASRQLLHCYKMEFKHPKTNKLTSISCSIGNYFSEFLNKARLNLQSR